MEVTILENILSVGDPTFFFKDLKEIRRKTNALLSM